MERHETNSAGVHLRDQTGQETIIGFDNLLAALPANLRAAFERERADRREEIVAIIAQQGYHT